MARREGKDREDDGAQGRPADAQGALRLDAIRAESPAALDLLHLCAFFAPDDIPLDMIVTGRNFLPWRLRCALRNRGRLDCAIAVLERHGVLQRSYGSAAVPESVQEVVRRGLDEWELARWASRAVQVAKCMMPPPGSSYEPAGPIARYLPHLLRSASLAHSLGVGDAATSMALDQAAEHLQQHGDLHGAKQALECAADIAQRRYGRDHVLVVSRLKRLAAVMAELNDLEGARANLERAIEVQERTRGRDDPFVAACLADLGIVLHRLGHADTARACLGRALRVAETSRSPRDMVATLRHSLGVFHYKSGDLAAARESLEEALGIYEDAYGPEDPRLVGVLLHLGGVLRELRGHGEARRCVERAVRLAERSLDRGADR